MDSGLIYQLDDDINLFREIRYDESGLYSDNQKYLAFVNQIVLIHLKNKNKQKYVRFHSSVEHFHYVQAEHFHYMQENYRKLNMNGVGVREVSELEVRRDCGQMSFEVFWS